MKLLQLLAASVSLFSSVKADADSSLLVGTWTSKSNQVFTGPGFFDPVDELLIEPNLPGRSISFTADGHYEIALYVVTPNPKDHGCPTAVLQWEHGSYNVSDESITLTPLEVDGRQLLSDPCNDGGTSTYSRYSSNVSFSYFDVYIDPYYGRYRLNMNGDDGVPWPPLWLAYKPALMLPTETLNPTAAGATATSASTRRRVKRSLENRIRTNAIHETADYSKLWYLGVALFGLGAVSYAFV